MTPVNASAFADGDYTPAQVNGNHVNKTIGIIGMGEMGKMYAKRIGAAGWR